MATTGVYNRAKALLMNGGLDLDNDDIRVLLVDNTYSFDPDHNVVADVAASEVTDVGGGTPYARKALTTETVTEDDANDRANFDADDPVWSGADFGTPDAIIVFKFVTNDADSPVIACLDITPKIATNTGSYTVAFNAGGIMRLL